MGNRRKRPSSRNRQASTRAERATFHPLRAELLELLGATEQPATLAELQAGLTNPVSREKLDYHLRVLRATGCVDATRGGRFREA